MITAVHSHAATKPANVPFGHHDCFFIGGEWVKASSNSTFDVYTPATEQLYVRVAEAQEADMNRAVAAAREAFDNGPWPRMTHAERASYLTAIGKKLNERAGDVAQVWPNEMGVLHGVASAMMPGIAGMYDYYASLAGTFRWEERHTPQGGGEAGLLVREPVGVVGAIIPWNGPPLLTACKIAPAFLAGCTVVLKASPEAPSSAYILAEIAAEIGLPKGVLNVVTADRAVSELLVRHPDVDKISFTGSTVAGRRIASLLGERIGRFTLELGGKSAAVVLDDYDLELAADAMVGPACWLSGQVCSSLTRMIVTRKRHDQFVDALAARMGKVIVGDPFDPASGIGPLAMKRQRDRVEGLIATGREEGAKLAVGGGRPKGLDRGYFIEPTVFGNVGNDMTIAREEIFGPVLGVIPAKDEEDAIRIANDTIYGLNNSVFTNDPDRAYAVARRLRSGTVGHNVFRSDLSIAFGGFKQSGIGREGGVDGLLPYTEAKTIILEGKAKHLS